MQHFLDIQSLSKDTIEALLERAMHFKYLSHFPEHRHCTMANLFYENSTRTRISFEIAAKNLSMRVINVDINNSSESKGESIEDTILNLAAMGVSHFVLRHTTPNLPAELATKCGNKVHIINAGDGQHAHPSQAMLDLMTIVEQKPNLKDLKIVIIGNIKHSRVANSLQTVFKTMGVGKLVLVSPSLWQPQICHYGEGSEDLHQGLQDADVVICLRVQRERLKENEHLDLNYYREHFTLTEKNMLLAKKDAMIMHPGPVNHDVEIATGLVQDKQSFILQQVTNGVFMRMAILEKLGGFAEPYI
jgi:aspartate carbamoyltransferase catalytic subunit